MGYYPLDNVFVVMGNSWQSQKITDRNPPFIKADSCGFDGQSIILKNTIVHRVH